MRTLLPIFLLLLLLVGGCGGHPGEADLKAARSCADFSSLLSQTHDWFNIRVINSDSRVVATINRTGQQLGWGDGSATEFQNVTDAEALAKLKTSLDGKPGKLSLNFAGLPRRGYFHVQVSPDGAVTKVEDFVFAD